MCLCLWMWVKCKAKKTHLPRPFSKTMNRLYFFGKYGLFSQVSVKKKMLVSNEENVCVFTLQHLKDE